MSAILKEDAGLIEAAAHVAKVAPSNWAIFVAAMQAYADVYRDKLVMSPRDRFEHNQGQAFQALRLSELFKDAVASANKLQEMREKTAARAGAGR